MDLKELYGLPHLVVAESYQSKANASVMVASNLTNKTSELSHIPSAFLNCHLPPASIATAELWHTRELGSNRDARRARR
jgi:hypothetical protein